jgi:deoxyribonuclease V
MMNKNNTKVHEWDVVPKEAIAIQQKLRQQVRLKPLNKTVKFIAGADVSLNRFEADLYAGIVVLSYPDLVVVEKSLVKMKTSFPYIPGLLSFREIPALLKAWQKLKIKPDLIMVDGQGIAHPRRLGIGAHFGVLVNTPTIGVAKSILVGKLKGSGKESKLVDPKSGEIIGIGLKTKLRSNTLIISPGSLITLEESAEWVKKCLRGYKLPEPTRLAHKTVNAFRRGEI